VDDDAATVVVALVMATWLLVIAFAVVRARRQTYERQH